MVEQDTIKLLRECDAGTKMGITSIDDVLSHTRCDTLHKKLSHCSFRGRSSSFWASTRTKARTPTPSPRACRG